MTVYEKATAEVVMFEVNDVISTSGGKEIEIWECAGGTNGYNTGSTSKECLGGNNIIFKG